MRDIKRITIDHKGLPFFDDEGVYVSYEDCAKIIEDLNNTENDGIDANCQISDLKQQLNALTAENVAFKSAIVIAKEGLQEHYDTDGVDSQDSEGNFMDACIRLCDAQCTIEKLESILTPATDAYLNSVRAEGIEMVLKLYKSERHLVADEDMAQYDFALSHLALMIAKLRAGKV